ncbi:hypothetical protein C8R47DRAFT_1083456 [Mycena vitilis]|nr:hypothetical protein C8R47DRAFT_1083456 [Mycena vitilis]
MHAYAGGPVDEFPACRQEPARGRPRAGSRGLRKNAPRLEPRPPQATRPASGKGDPPRTRETHSPPRCWGGLWTPPSSMGALKEGESGLKMPAGKAAGPARPPGRSPRGCPPRPRERTTRDYSTLGVLQRQETTQEDAELVHPVLELEGAQRGLIFVRVRGVELAPRLARLVLASAARLIGLPLVGVRVVRAKPSRPTLPTSTQQLPNHGPNCPVPFVFEGGRRNADIPDASAYEEETWTSEPRAGTNAAGGEDGRDYWAEGSGGDTDKTTKPRANDEDENSPKNPHWECVAAAPYPPGIDSSAPEAEHLPHPPPNPLKRGVASLILKDDGRGLAGGSEMKSSSTSISSPAPVSGSPGTTGGVGVGEGRRGGAGDGDGVGVRVGTGAVAPKTFRGSSPCSSTKASRTRPGNEKKKCTNNQKAPPSGRRSQRRTAGPKAARGRRCGGPPSPLKWSAPGLLVVIEEGQERTSETSPVCKVGTMVDTTRSEAIHFRRDRQHAGDGLRVLRASGYFLIALRGVWKGEVGDDIVYGKARLETTSCVELNAELC